MAAAWITLIVTILWAMHGGAEASLDIGVCYGLLGDNLPPATDVVNLYKKIGIGKVRLFDPDPAALQALRGSQIDVTVGVKNQDLQQLSLSQDAVNAWFAANIEPYLDSITFEYIAVGNEVIPGELGQFVLPVMQFLQVVLDQKHLAGIRISTVIPGAALGTSFPPSQGAFLPESINTMTGILEFLSAKSSPLLINVYPYFAYAGDPDHVSLPYAQFTATSPVIQDEGLSYYNLFDATVDAFFSAMEKAGGSDVDVVVTESGWPSAGNGDFTTPELASTYNKNFVSRILSYKGTPKRPHAYIEGFIFATFNENMKPTGVEQNFGLFYPNMEPVYPVFLLISLTGSCLVQARYRIH